MTLFMAAAKQSPDDIRYVGDAFKLKKCWTIFDFRNRN